MAAEDFSILGTFGHISVGKITTGRLFPRYKETDWILIDRRATPTLDDEVIVDGAIVDYDGVQEHSGVLRGRCMQDPTEAAQVLAREESSHG